MFLNYMSQSWKSMEKWSLENSMALLGLDAGPGAKTAAFGPWLISSSENSPAAHPTDSPCLTKRESDNQNEIWEDASQNQVLMVLKHPRFQVFGS